jgi:dihydroorotase
MPPTYDLLISGGNLIDVAQEIDARRDIAFSGGKVAAVAERIDPAEAAETIDAAGKMVVPGLIDAHVHVYEGVSHYGINADRTCLAHGATTVVDAGSAGAETFAGFRKYVIEASDTRILAHVNISSMGMISRDIGELDDLKWASVPKALQAIEANRDVVLGVKVRLTRTSLVGHDAGLKPLYLAREAADAAGLPIMVHPQDSWAESLDDVLAVMRGGDVMTHMYHGMRHGILDEDGRIRKSVREARDRGVIFDVGHGEGSFDWEICEQALAQGFPPTTISSDLHKYNVDGPVYDLVTTMSKFLMLGMPLHDALAKVTSVPAGVVGMEGRIGTLAPGAEGDAVVLEMEEGDFAFQDSRRITRSGRARLAVREVVKAGRRWGVAGAAA